MGTLGVSSDSMPKVPQCWCRPEGTCDPGQAGLSASLINAVTGSARLDWRRSCVPLTRGLKIPWRITKVLKIFLLHDKMLSKCKHIYIFLKFSRRPKGLKQGHIK